MTLHALIDLWLQDRQRAGCKPSSLRVYRSRTRSLRAALGDRDLGELTRQEWIEWLAHETHWGEGRSKARDTVRLIVTIVSMLQTFALEQELIAAAWLRPRDLKKPPARQRERVATRDETRRILAAAAPDFRAVYEALRLTGARPSELAAARIEQIRHDGRLRTLVLSDHKTSHTGRTRKIPLGADVAGVFDRAIGGRSAGPIFLRADGTPWSRAALTTAFRKLRRQLGLPEDLKLYATRHEFVTAVTRVHGIGLAQQLAGHASPATTARYHHPSDETLHAAQRGLYGTSDDREGSNQPHKAWDAA